MISISVIPSSEGTKQIKSLLSETTTAGCAAINIADSAKVPIRAAGNRIRLGMSTIR
jgi:hypothetical protein